MLTRTILRVLSGSTLPSRLFSLLILEAQTEAELLTRAKERVVWVEDAKNPEEEKCLSGCHIARKGTAAEGPHKSNNSFYSGQS